MKTASFLDGRVQLYCGDARRVLKTIGRVDHFITDPPYEKHMHAAKGASRKDDRGNARGHKIHGAQRKIRTDGHANPKPVDFSSIVGLREVIVPLLAKNCDGWLIAFCTPEGIAPWRDAIEAAKARYKRACFWFKPDGAPQFNGQGPAMAVECFVTAWCGKGFSRWNGGGRRNLFTHQTNASDRDGRHPTEKPLALMKELIELFTDPNDLICDPFMGGGSTGIACIARGRRFIGIEKDPKYYDIAVERIHRATLQPDLFVRALRAQQENLFATPTPTPESTNKEIPDEGKSRSEARAEKSTERTKRAEGTKGTEIAEASSGS